MAAHAPPVVLTFGLSDPTGATGLAADVTTCAAMGCHAAGVITAISVQDSVRVLDLQAVDSELVDDQARAVLEDMPVAAFKIGALASSGITQSVAEILADYDDVPVVLDPGLAIAVGEGPDSRSTLEVMTAICELVLPRTTVLTADLDLARRLATVIESSAEEPGEDAAEAIGAAQVADRLRDGGAEYVLLTGVRTAAGLNVNTLFGPDGEQQNESIDRIDLRFRGAGDTLSAAIASLLAQGIGVGDAVREAHDFLGQSLAAGFRLGMGAATPDRMFWATDGGQDDDE